MHLQWTPSASASALHAAEAINRFEHGLADHRAATALDPYARGLGQWIEKKIPGDTVGFWSSLIMHSVTIESNFELATIVLRKSPLNASDPGIVNQLAGFITDIEAAYKELFPKLLEQLHLRARPLQDQWLGFGSGLTAHLGRLTEKELLVPEARVVLIQPILGGYGLAHLLQNMVRIEAVLTNPLVELPEVVRLAWLLSQLHLDLPRNSDSIGMVVLQRLAPLAMLPPVLAAAEVLELSKCDDAMAELAIENWHIAIPTGSEAREDIVPVLMDWWETYLRTRPTWHTAMQALAKMLGFS